MPAARKPTTQNCLKAKHIVSADDVDRTPPGGQSGYSPPGGQSGYSSPGGQSGYSPPPGGRSDYLPSLGGQSGHSPPLVVGAATRPMVVSAGTRLAAGRCRASLRGPPVTREACRPLPPRSCPGARAAAAANQNARL